MNNNQSRINLLKEVKSAVNTASFAPTPSRIEDAKKAVQSLMSYVESLEAPKRKKPQKKASTKPSSQNEKMLAMIQQMFSEGMTFNEMSHEERLAAGQESASYEADLDKPKAKRRRKTKQKSSKATAATKVADKQEKAFHGRPDSPVTPSTRKPKASVEAARKAAQDVSRHTGAESRAKRKAEAVKEAVVMPKAAPMEVTSSDDRVASLEAQLAKLMAEHKQLTDTLLVMSTNDVMPAANEVCFSDLPFDPTSNL